ncbi:IS110 family transposase [Sinomonas cellulolyticus]|uniref:IS110 family transposase n=1 Tax=Sinomonas cellulolyticus TaxID=2801916 RepID=A0ABS1K4Q1_9MICC|nr:MULTISPECIES: IS110 family transposase [Sinomonas]MBL0706656.1 IS110 family transposase [Sinomonas cellulolyticus]GHG60911.1 IS110 family transposase [Sinomonas sp. KCTC 49339]
MQVWAGVDAGKTGHHCVAIDTDGTRLLSRKVRNDEEDLTSLIAEVNALGTDVVWATDLNRGGASLMIALLHAHGQRLMYIPGRTVHHASRLYRGDGKTDAKDAAVIADQARMRHDLQPLRTGDEVSADLRILTARRADIAEDRTRAINRLRATLLEYFPALEAAFDYSRSKAALTLLTRHSTPDGIRRCGQSRLQAWLKKQGARSSAAVAEAAVAAARRQHTVVPGQGAGALAVAGLAKEVLRIQDELAGLDALIAERAAEHPHTEVITSMPGFGPLLAAEFLAATGGDLGMFENADRLAAVAGLAPVPRDSGKITGNHRRPQRYDRRLLRVFYLAALSSLKSSPESRAYFDRKRVEGKTHVQAILCLARRRVNVLWAMLRDRSAYAPPGQALVIPAAA